MKALITLIFVYVAVICSAQEMFLQSQRYHNKWRSTIGVGGVEPISTHIQFYRGFSCKSARGWLLEIQVGMEGMVRDINGIPYQTGQFRKGAVRYSIAYNRKLFRGVQDYIPWLGFLAGFGLQGGNRNYLDENGMESKLYALGPQFNFNIETYIIDKRINRDQYLGVILFAEYLYHREFTGEFDVSRVNGGLRLNFYN